MSRGVTAIAAAVELLQAQSQILQEAVEAATHRTPEPVAELPKTENQLPADRTPDEDHALHMAEILKDTCFEVPLDSGSTMRDARRVAWAAIKAHAEIMPEIALEAATAGA